MVTSLDTTLARRAWNRYKLPKHSNLEKRTPTHGDSHSPEYLQLEESYAHFWGKVAHLNNSLRGTLHPLLRELLT